jgi:membrane protein DedA with SNARE-associated domain
MEYAGSFLSHLTTSFQYLGVWGYWVIAGIAFADSLIFVGTFISGAAFLVLAGVLVSQGVYDLGDMAFFAAAGAVLGGVASYGIGRWWNNRPVKESKIAEEKHLERGTTLLKQYGGVGIVFGRFLGPLSSMITFVAGLSGMPARSFLLWNAFGGLVWAVSYVFLGYLLGDSFSLLNIF